MPPYVEFQNGKEHVGRDVLPSARAVSGFGLVRNDHNQTRLSLALLAHSFIYPPILALSRIYLFYILHASSALTTMAKFAYVLAPLTFILCVHAQTLCGPGTLCPSATRKSAARKLGCPTHSFSTVASLLL